MVSTSFNPRNEILFRKIINRLARSRHFHKLLAEKDESWLNPKDKHFAKVILPNCSINKAVWCAIDKAYITKDIRDEIQYIKIQDQEHISGKKEWEKPISHIIKRKLDKRIRQDACTSWGTGGFLVELQFWWQLK